MSVTEHYFIDFSIDRVSIWSFMTFKRQINPKQGDQIWSLKRHNTVIILTIKTR